MQKLPMVDSLPFSSQEVKTLDRLRELVGEEMVKAIMEQHELGDPDWFFDIVSELDGNPPINSNCDHLHKFWDPLVSAGYKSVHFDCMAISLEIDAILMAKYKAEAEDEDDDIDPAGGYGIQSHI